MREKRQPVQVSKRVAATIARRLRERERTKAWAREFLTRLVDVAERPEDAGTLAEIRAEVERIAEHGYESSLEVVTVDGVVTSVNGMPVEVWRAFEQGAFSKVDGK